MAAPEDAKEVELVRKAIILAGEPIGGCLDWHIGQAERLSDQPTIPDLYPSDVLELLIQFVKSAGAIVQKKETRKEIDKDTGKRYCDMRAYWYKANIPYEGLPTGLFVEFWLKDDDPDYPTVELLNHHK